MGRKKKVHFGQYIRELRTDKGITLREFARQLDVSPTYISQIEQGNFGPPAGRPLATPHYSSPRCRRCGLTM